MVETGGVGGREVRVIMVKRGRKEGSMGCKQGERGKEL